MLKNLEGGKLTNSCFYSTPSNSRPVSLGNVTFPWRMHIRKTFYHSILNLKTRKPNWSKTQTTTLVKVLSTIQSYVRSWLLEPAGKCQLETCPSEKCRVAHFSPLQSISVVFVQNKGHFWPMKKLRQSLKTSFAKKRRKSFFSMKGISFYSDLPKVFIFVVNGTIIVRDISRKCPKTFLMAASHWF